MKNRFRYLAVILFLLSLTLVAVSQLPKERPAARALALLKWYSANYASIDSIRYLNYPKSEEDTTDISVNFRNAEKYFSVLKKSGFFSSHYIRAFRNYFRQCDREFKAEPELARTSFLAEGDLIMLSNSDYKQELAQIDSAQVLQDEIHPTSAIAIIELPWGRQ